MQQRRRDLVKVTAQHVAEEAGVSASAVSRTYTPGASISRATELKVLAAARKLGYRPNILARSLMTNRTNLVGILIKDFQNPVYLQIIDALTTAIQIRGLQALIINIARSGGIRESVDVIMQYQADGLIETSGSALEPKLAAECLKQGMPLVQFGFHEKDQGASAVCCDNYAGGEVAGNLLLDSGYRRLAFVGGAADSVANRQRLDGFISALMKRGKKLWLTETAGDWAYEGGFNAASRLLNAKRPPDALFCADDIIAMGAIDAVRSDFKLRVPEDIGVVGFDDIALAGSRAYGLTTIQQPYEQMVEAALDILQNQIESPTKKPVTKVFSGKTMIRDSHRRVPGEHMR